MTRPAIGVGVFVTALVLLVLAVIVRYPAREPDVEPAAAAAPALTPASPAAEATADVRPGFLYGRITALDGATYEGRLRWGRDQEAFWGDYFNGTKDKNPWAAHAPLAQRPRERSAFEIF